MQGVKLDMEIIFQCYRMEGQGNILGTSSQLFFWAFSPWLLFLGFPSLFHFFAFLTFTLGLFLLFLAFRRNPYEEGYGFVISDWLSRQLRGDLNVSFYSHESCIQVTTHFIRGTAGGYRKPWCYRLKTYCSNWLYALGCFFSYCCFVYTTEPYAEIGA